MEDFHWSDRKEELFELTRNTVVSASAGTGKTTALTELIVRWLEDDPDNHSLQDLVAITFTEKAAGEMKQRIQEFILDRQERGERLTMWDRARRSLPAAYIGTIHAFCTRILRENAIRFGLDPDFSVLDPRDASRHLSRIINRYIVESVRNREEGALELLRNFGFREDASGQHDLHGILRSLLNQCWNNGVQPPDVRRQMHGWIKEIPEQIEQRVQTCHEAIDAILQLSEDDLTEKSLERVRRFRSGSSELKRWLADLDASTPLVRFTEWRRRAKPVLSGHVSKALKEARAPLRKNIGYPRSTPTSSSRGDLQKMVAFLKSRSLHDHVLNALVRIDETFTRFKREQGYLDFNDLLFTARDGLKRDLPLRNRYKKEFDLILIDEFQDVNRLQYELLFLLCETSSEATPIPENGSVRDEITLDPAKFVVVGDPKQSIYRFRGADVAVYRQTLNDVHERGGTSFSFRENYRSLPDLITFFNGFSRHLFSSDDAPYSISYNSDDDLCATRDPLPNHEDDPCVEVLSPSDTSGGSQQMRYREARTLTERIRQITDPDTSSVRVEGDDGSTRVPGYGDVAVLFRSTSHIESYERAFRRAGIPHHLFKGQDFFDTPEIRDIANLFSFLASPEKPIPLLGVLKSPLIGVIEDTTVMLKDVANRDYDGDLVKAFWAADPEPFPNGEAPKIRTARETLRRLIRARDRVPPPELVRITRRSTDLDAVLAQGARGPQATANLDKLTSMLDDQHRRDQMGFFDAASFLRDSVETGAVEEEAPLPENEAEHVQLMTIHSAKGLEFPVVLLADMGSVRPRVQGTCLYDPDQGVGMRWRSPDTDIPHQTWSYRTVRDELKQKDRAESRRLLYVAMTRARDYLLLSGWYQAGSHGSPRKRNTWWSLVEAAMKSDLDDSFTTFLSDLDGSVIREVDPGTGSISVRFSRITDTENESAPDSPSESVPAADSLSDLRKRTDHEDLDTTPGSLSISYQRHGVREMHMTATDVLELLKCPRRYAFLQEQRRPEDMGEEQLIPRQDIQRSAWKQAGILAHALLEHPDAASRPRQDLREHARRTKAGRFLPDEILEEVVERVQAGYEHVHGQFLEHADRTERETDFALHLEDPNEEWNATVEGTVDLLVTRDDRLLILDYKYAHRREEKIADDRLQLLLYALAYREPCEARQQIRCALYYLREERADRGLYVMDPSGDDLDTFEQNVRDALTVASESEHTPPLEWPGEPDPDPCHDRRCGFIPFCWDDSTN